MQTYTFKYFILSSNHFDVLINVWLIIMFRFEYIMIHLRINIISRKRIDIKVFFYFFEKEREVEEAYHTRIFSYFKRHFYIIWCMFFQNLFYETTHTHDTTSYIQTLRKKYVRIIFIDTRCMMYTFFPAHKVFLIYDPFQ